jgi:hypothetical protein
MDPYSNEPMTLSSSLDAPSFKSFDPKNIETDAPIDPKNFKIEV